MEKSDTRCRKRLLPLIEGMLNEERYLDCGLKWIDKSKKIFQLPWKVKKKSRDGDNDAKVIAYIAERMWPKRDKLKEWKELFRNALRSVEDFEELKDQVSREHDYKVYRIVETQPRRSKVKASLRSKSSPTQGEAKTDECSTPESFLNNQTSSWEDQTVPCSCPDLKTGMVTEILEPRFIKDPNSTKENGPTERKMIKLESSALPNFDSILSTEDSTCDSDQIACTVPNSLTQYIATPTLAVPLSLVNVPVDFQNSAPVKEESSSGEESFKIDFLESFGSLDPSAGSDITTTQIDDQDGLLDKNSFLEMNFSFSDFSFEPLLTPKVQGVLVEVFYLGIQVFKERINDEKFTLFPDQLFECGTDSELGRKIQMENIQSCGLEQERPEQLLQIVSQIQKKMRCGITFSVEDDSIYALRRCQSAVVAKVINDPNSIINLKRSDRTKCFDFRSSFVPSLQAHRDHSNAVENRPALPSSKCRFTVGCPRAFDDNMYGPIDIYIQHMEASLMLCEAQELSLMAADTYNSGSNTMDRFIQTMESCVESMNIS